MKKKLFIGILILIILSISASSNELIFQESVGTEQDTFFHIHKDMTNKQYLEYNITGLGMIEFDTISGGHEYYNGYIEDETIHIIYDDIIVAYYSTCTG